MFDGAIEEADGRARSGRNRRAVRVGLALGALFFLTGPAFAQEVDPVTAWGKGGCSNCHGGIGQGGGGGEDPVGPSLRETALTRDEIAETIACGRPVSGMPFNLVGAYTETACYGFPLGPPPRGTDQGASLSQEEVDAIADFLIANVVGVTNITRAACAVFFRGNVDSPACLRYPP
jgi:mono/diheme cytochrome c family protein